MRRREQTHKLQRTMGEFCAVGAALLLLYGCAAPMHKGSHCTVDENFLGAQQTFAWGPGGAVDLIDESGYISPAIVSQLKRRVAQELASKGFRLVDTDTSDVAVDVEVQLFLRTRREIVSSSPQGALGGPCVYPDCWHAPHDRGEQITARTTGFLAADVYYQGEAIWRGWVERMLYPSERDQAWAVIDQAVPVLFEKFPP